VVWAGRTNIRLFVLVRSCRTHLARLAILTRVTGVTFARGNCGAGSRRVSVCGTRLAHICSLIFIFACFAYHACLARTTGIHRIAYTVCDCRADSRRVSVWWAGFTYSNLHFRTCLPRIAHMSGHFRQSTRHCTRRRRRLWRQWSKLWKSRGMERMVCLQQR